MVLGALRVVWCGVWCGVVLGTECQAASSEEAGVQASKPLKQANNMQTMFQSLVLV